MLIIVAIVLGYGLSIGPSYLLLRKGDLSQKAFSNIYFPILHFADRSASMDRVLDWYLEFWYSDVKEIQKSFRSANTNN